MSNTQPLETCRRVAAITGALLALGIAIPFTVVYANQYHSMQNNGDVCIATQTTNNSTSSIDVANRFKSVMYFGYVYFCLCSIFLIFAFISAIHPVAGAINALFQSCCVAPVGTAQVVVLGVYRFSWSGSACSYPGAPLEQQGKFLQNMFIAQLVLQGFYICCASSGTTIKKS